MSGFLFFAVSLGICLAGIITTEVPILGIFTIPFIMVMLLANIVLFVSGIYEIIILSQDPTTRRQSLWQLFFLVLGMVLFWLSGSIQVLIAFIS